MRTIIDYCCFTQEALVKRIALLEEQEHNEHVLFNLQEARKFLTPTK